MKQWKQNNNFKLAPSLTQRWTPGVEDHESTPRKHKVKHKKVELEIYLKER